MAILLSGPASVADGTLLLTIAPRETYDGTTEKESPSCVFFLQLPNTIAPPVPAVVAQQGWRAAG